jgi:hypothetical protein
MSIVISSSNFHWPNGIMPFEIDATDFPLGSAERTTIQNAINHWNQNTIIRLQPRRGERDFVRFVAVTQGCSSPIGRQGGMQTIGCNLMNFGEGNIIHEIGHAVGLFHEHVRQDRDDHVAVHFDNIEPGQEHNFQQQNDRARDVGPYDYSSIMHYGPRGFALDSTQNTITAPSPFDTVIGQRNGLSSGDIAGVEETYRLRHERFFAVWKQSSRSEIQVYSVPYQAYRARYDELWPQGWRLRLLNVSVIRGQVRYTAVWGKSTSSEIQVYGWKYEDYRAKYDELWPQGWRLHILQPYVINNQVRYTAVWRKSTRGEIQVYGWKYEDYRAKYDELWPQGWRLRLIQPYGIHDQVRYTAVWTKSTRGEIQVYGWKYRDYRAKYDELWQQGWRLYRLQPYRIRGEYRLTAVWHHRPGRGEYQVYHHRYAHYRAFYDEKWPENWRLQNLVVI